MSDKPSKKYPLASNEVAGMMGIHAEEDPKALPVVEEQGNNAKAPGNLPIKDLPVVEHKASMHDHHQDETEVEQPASQHLPMIKVAKNLAPYLAIFVLGIFLYVFFFSNVDLTSAFKFQTKARTPQQSALEKLQKDNLDGYQKWIAQFYYDVSDSKILDPDADNSGNGLTNFQKYLLNLNPKSYDTLGLGMSDSETLAKGINPLSGNALTDQQKQIVEKYFDMEVVMNRLALANLQKQAEQVAGVNIQGNYAAFGAPAASNDNAAAPSTLYENLDINTDIPGRLEIPDLKVNVPIIWSKDTKSIDTDLRSGVVHYPGTALPGQIGTSYISGHSSNYVWAKGDYNHVFTHLDELADNTSFKVTVVQKNGKDAILYYVVTGRQEYDPKDQAQFTNGGKSVMALSTCWPVGSTAKRLVVFGELTQVQK